MFRNSIVKRIVKSVGFLAALFMSYALIALVCTAITVNKNQDTEAQKKEIYLSTNGVHVDIILTKQSIDDDIMKSIPLREDDKYIAFGWGDKDFYLNTPTWNDLTFSTAFKALFLKSETLMHCTKYTHKSASWISIKVSEQQLKALKDYILKSFASDKNGERILLSGISYGSNDFFFEAVGSYSCIKTCNTWANSALKTAKIKACLWTPFDYGILNIHKAAENR